MIANNQVTDAHYQAKVRDLLAALLKPWGKAVCFGWNSGGLNKDRGFQLVRLVDIYHGRGRNDTIITVQIKTS